MLELLEKASPAAVFSVAPMPEAIATGGPTESASLPWLEQRFQISYEQVQRRIDFAVKTVTTVIDGLSSVASRAVETGSEWDFSDVIDLLEGYERQAAEELSRRLAENDIILKRIRRKRAGDDWANAAKRWRSLISEQLTELLVVYRDARWELMAIQEEGNPSEVGPVFEDSDTLKKYFRGLG